MQHHENALDKKSSIDAGTVQKDVGGTEKPVADSAVDRARREALAVIHHGITHESAPSKNKVDPVAFLAETKVHDAWLDERMAEKRSQPKAVVSDEELKSKLAMVDFGFRADLANHDLNGRDFKKANLKGATISDASCIGADFSGSNMRQVDCSDANFKNANLDGAVLRDGSCFSASFEGASLTSADLRRASFTKTDFTNADLQGADLREAIFSEDTVLTGAKIDGKTDLRDAFIPKMSIFNDVDLTTASPDRLPPELVMMRAQQQADGRGRPPAILEGNSSVPSSVPRILPESGRGQAR